MFQVLSTCTTEMRVIYASVTFSSSNLKLIQLNEIYLPFLILCLIEICQGTENLKGALLLGGYAVVQLVEALRKKPEDCGFDSRWGL